MQNQSMKSLNDFVMASRAQVPLFLSNEKQLRITGWIASTAKALATDPQEEEQATLTSLSVIPEQ